MQKTKLFLRCCLLFGVLSLGATACLFGASSRSSQYYRYVVRAGDSLPNIAWYFNVSETELLILNNLNRGEGLRAGSTIIIPRRGQTFVAEKPPVRMFVAPVLTPIPAPKQIVGRISSPVIARNRGQLLWPILNGKLISRFGPRRNSFHEGIDIKAASGTEIRAAHGGTVVYSNNGMRGYGNLIALQGEGLMTVYAHNRRNLVRTGDKVSRGQKIGQVGMTGRASGTHLHFEVRIKDPRGRYVAVDPMVFLQSTLTAKK